MTDRELMQMALDIIFRYRKETPLGNQPHMIALVADDTIKALRTALAQPEKEWVWLTDEEIRKGNKDSWVTRQAWESAVWWAEKKLKEKNETT